MIRYYYFSKVNTFLRSDQFNTPWGELSTGRKIALSRDRAFSQFDTGQESEILREKLLEIIQLCQSNNIELIGIKFPLTREYIQAIGDRIDDTAYRRTRYGASDLLKMKGYEVMDFKSVYVDHEEYFENQDHLNLMGGQAFVKVAFRQ